MVPLASAPPTVDLALLSLLANSSNITDDDIARYVSAVEAETVATSSQRMKVFDLAEATAAAANATAAAGGGQRQKSLAAAGWKRYRFVLRTRAQQQEANQRLGLTFEGF